MAVASVAHHNDFEGSVQAFADYQKHVLPKTLNMEPGL